MSISLICGPMFAGKSNRLHQLIREKLLRGEECVFFVASIDTRYTREALSVSHDGSRVYAVRITTLETDPAMHDDVQHIFVDEGQFLPGLAAFALRQKLRGRHVYIAALSSDYRGRAWPEISALVPVHVAQYTPIVGACIVCNGDAFYSRRIEGGENLVDVGGEEKYVSTCWAHFGDETPITAEMRRNRASVLAKLGSSQ